MRLVSCLIMGIFLFPFVPTATADNYRIGRGISDITGPPVGLALQGYNRHDQISEGIQSRQYARAFVIAENEGQKRVAIIVADLCLLSHTLKHAVVEKLRETLGDTYNHENLMLTASHSHAAVGGFHHHQAQSPIGGGFCQPYFDALVDGISEAVLKADDDLAPGEIFLASGQVEGAGVNRSLPAYMNNPAEERARYNDNTDKTMVLLKFVRADVPIGMINWFATHPTSMNLHNKLICGDNKGHASFLFESKQGMNYLKLEGFVGAFANTNCGDVTPNLNLDGTGPGQSDLESTQIIGQRLFSAAEDLFNNASERLSGPIRYIHNFVDMSQLEVSEEFTGGSSQRLCASAVGYSMAAGSTEDGGGHPLFVEGMRERNPLVEALISVAGVGPIITEAFRQCQSPKPILLAPGLAQPKMQEQVLPFSIVQIGPLITAWTSSEITTMAGRRLREAIATAIQVAPTQVVIACYANCFSAYVTTYEEYQSQQYEGAHTLFGPWTEAGLRQEFVRLARALASNQAITTTAQCEDMRPRVENTWKDISDELKPRDAHFGDVVVQPQKTYRAGDTVEVAFWTGHPSSDYCRGERYFEIQHTVDGQTGLWETVAHDGIWGATSRWTQILTDENGQVIAPPKIDPYALNSKPSQIRPEPYQASLTWIIPRNQEPGEYRIQHNGRFKKDGELSWFESVSDTFTIVSAEN
jgi:neutral ceramidase